MGNSLDGKVAIVTGSGQGIGQGIAIGLAREGAKVITNNRKLGGYSSAEYRKEEMPEEDWEEFCALKGDAQTTADKIAAEGGEALAFFGDPSDWDTAAALVQKAKDTWGRLDIVVNGAAGMGMGGIETLTDEVWDDLTVSRSKAAFHMMHFAAPLMKEKGFGRIINISSDAWVGLADNDAYSCATAGIIGLTWASAKELNRFGITVNVICPQGSSPAHAVEYRKMLRHVEAATGQKPDSKLLAVVEADHGDPTNLGPIVAYLCTEDAGSISGSVFSATSAGRVSMYSYPQAGEQIYNDGKVWTVDQLKDAFATVLGADYVAPGASVGWGH